MLTERVRLSTGTMQCVLQQHTHTFDWWIHLQAASPARQTITQGNQSSVTETKSSFTQEPLGSQSKGKICTGLVLANGPPLILEDGQEHEVNEGQKSIWDPIGRFHNHRWDTRRLFHLGDPPGNPIQWKIFPFLIYQETPTNGRKMREKNKNITWLHLSVYYSVAQQDCVLYIHTPSTGGID